MTLLAIPLLGTILAGLALPVGQRLGRRTGWATSIGLLLIAALVLMRWHETTGGVRSESTPWLPALGVALRLRLDGLALAFALVVLLVGCLVLAYAVNYLPRGRHGWFYALLTFFAAAMLGLVLADDVVLMWVMWEFTTITSFLLILQSGPKGRDPAIRTLVVTGGGGLCLLAAVALMVAATGTTDLSAILASPE